MNTIIKKSGMAALAAVMVGGLLSAAQPAQAQRWDRDNDRRYPQDRNRDNRGDWGRDRDNRGDFDRDRTSRVQVERLIIHLERSSNAFRQAFERGGRNDRFYQGDRYGRNDRRDDRRYDGRDDLKRMIQRMDESIEDLRRDFDRSDRRYDTRNKVAEVMRYARPVDDFMDSRRRYQSGLESHWSQVRGSLNALASHYGIGRI